MATEQLTAHFKLEVTLDPPVSQAPNDVLQDEVARRQLEFVGIEATPEAIEELANATNQATFKWLNKRYSMGWNE